MTLYRPAKQTSKRSPPQQSILPVPDLSDVDALLSKPRFSADASFDPDPRFQLFEQKSVYDNLPGSYVDQPLGTLYPNALDAELNHTLAEAWRFNPVALSIREARETACELARTPGHGLNEEVISWVKSMGLSRVQTQYRGKEAGDITVKNCLLYEHFADLHGEPSVLKEKTLQEELDSFYDPFIGEGGPQHEPQPVDGTEVDKDSNGLNNHTMWSSLPARRGWLGGLPAPISIANPSSVRLDHGSGATLLPTPHKGNRLAPADSSGGTRVAQHSSMISPPLTGVNFTSANNNYYELTIPADLAMTRAAQLNLPCSPPNTAILVMQASDQNQVKLAPANTPTFEAKLGPLRNPKQAGNRLALFENRVDTEWRGKPEGPYDFFDFCSASLESEHSYGSEPPLHAGDIDGAARLHTMMPDANGTDGAASPKTTVPNANEIECASSYGTTRSDDVTDQVVSIAKTLKAPAGAANKDCCSHGGLSEAANTQATTSGDTKEQTPPTTVENAPNDISTPQGTPEQAMNLAQDLEQSIHCAVSQTASLARVLAKPSSPFPSEPLVNTPTAQGLQQHSECPVILGRPTDRQIQTQLIPEHDGNKYPQTQPTIAPTQTESVCHEPHQLRSNTFTTALPQLTPEYNSTSGESHRASLDSLSAGIFSSPTYRTQGGQNALRHYIRETSSYPTPAAYDDMSMSMSISNASSLSPEPEDMALTPTNTEFGPDDLTPSDPLEEVSLIEDSSSTTSSTTLNGLQQSHGLNFACGYSPYLNAFGPTSVSDYATPAPALITPDNNTPSSYHLNTPFQFSNPSQYHALVLPSTTPGTPTPAQRASDQHHSKKSSSAMLRHRNAILDTKMRKSVKSVFESNKLGSRSPSPGKKAASDGGDGDVGIKFIMENGQAMKRTQSSPGKATPTDVALPASMARTRSQDKASSAASIGMARTKSQDQVAHAVIVPGKRKSNANTDGTLREEAAKDIDDGQVRKKLRRSIRTSEHMVAGCV